MNTRLMTLFTMLVLLGVSSVVAAHPCNRDPDYENHRHCITEPDPDPDPVVTYTIALSSGEFVFGAVDVFVNPKGTTLNGVGSLELDRPGEAIARKAWDDLFAECSLMPNPVASFSVEDVDWSVTVTGDDAGTGLITFRLHNMVVTPTPAVRKPDFDLNLTYRKTIIDDPFLPDLPGAFNSSKFPLDTYILWGGAHGGLRCQPKGERASYQPLFMGSDLIISRE